jgi:cyclic pyranopterin phosphate synthase
MPAVAEALAPAPLDAAPRDALGRGLRDLRVSVIDRCNFRCPYCMPEDRHPADDESTDAATRLSPAEIERIARAFVALGVDKLRLTGGEPLLRRDLVEIVERLARIPGVRDLALTTNGSLVAAQANALRRAGLHRVTVSLDAIDEAVFARLSGGRGSAAAVLAGIEAAVAAGFDAIKVNTVVVRGINEDQVAALAARFRGTPHVLRFIEYMDVGTCNRWRREQVVPSAELLARLDARWPLRALARARAGEVAERWAYADGQGEIGFVSSISAPFCGDCNRARLSADGRLFTCLFATAGTELRPLLADDAALRARIAAAWSVRVDRHSEQRAGSAARPARRIEMFRIGG